MSCKHYLMAAIGLIAMLPAGSLFAADANSNETRLREALRNTMLQLRTSEGDRMALQAAAVQSADEKKTLTTKVEALTKQCKADKENADKAIAGLKSQVASQAAEIGEFKDSIAKLQAEYKKADDIGRAKEAERAKLASDIIVLQRVVADQKVKNAALFKLGNEILTRYEKYGLGDAIGAREPFTGIARVKLQNYVQDYADKLADQRVQQ